VTPGVQTPASRAPLDPELPAPEPLLDPVPPLDPPELDPAPLALPLPPPLPLLLADDPPELLDVEPPLDPELPPTSLTPLSLASDRSADPRTRPQAPRASGDANAIRRRAFRIGPRSPLGHIAESVYSHPTAYLSTPSRQAFPTTQAGIPMRALSPGPGRREPPRATVAPLEGDGGACIKCHTAHTARHFRRGRVPRISSALRRSAAVKRRPPPSRAQSLTAVADRGPRRDASSGKWRYGARWPAFSVAPAIVPRRRGEGERLAFPKTGAI
jgi:hypothetical protein